MKIVLSIIMFMSLIGCAVSNATNNGPEMKDSITATNVTVNDGTELVAEMNELLAEIKDTKKAAEYGE